ncbi:hypothetical protein CC99x_000935 [Candidatus Berkiella cookevillensis]|uniref:Uncharacterized protein n=1 Tax=Candidatus Berkiella cookevillensis TaxID=437022 RepID=A0A0Q9YTX9_9GAMM|nr:hypothetical protein [Candidatus Berkiella cookevillensis]MCS5707460.1 hypothetical protein [Candidatus Berkiella cookevillensis]
MPNTKLVCFGFDQTIVNGHFHSAMMGRRIKPNDENPGVQVLQQDGTFKNMHTGKDVPNNGGASLQTTTELLDSPDGLKNSKEVADTIRYAIDNGHKVAITSFTLYPEVVLPTLQKLGLEDKYIQQICIVGGFPDHNTPDNSPDGKEQHIAAAIQHFNNQGAGLTRIDAMLVDDTTNNLDKAPPGTTNVAVPKYQNLTPTYFETIKSFVSKALSTTMEKPTVEKLPLELEAMVSILERKSLSKPISFSGSHKVTSSSLSSLIQTDVSPFAPMTPKKLGLDKGNVTTYPEKPGNIYIKFDNPTDMQAACINLERILGSNTFRIANQENTIQIYSSIQAIMEVTPPVVTPASLAIDKGALHTYPEKPGNVYLVFKTAGEMQAAQRNLNQVFGEKAFRVAAQENTIQIYREIQNLLGVPTPDITPTSLGLNKGKPEAFANRPGNIYLVFKTAEDMQAACNNLSKVFGENSFRMASNANTIQIYREVQNLIGVAPTLSSQVKATSTPADFGLDKGTLKKFNEYPGKFYMEFTSDAERDKAHQLLNKAFGEGASRIVSQTKTIEINDKVEKFLEKEPKKKSRSRM